MGGERGWEATPRKVGLRQHLPCPPPPPPKALRVGLPPPPESLPAAEGQALTPPFLPVHAGPGCPSLSLAPLRRTCWGHSSKTCDVFVRSAATAGDAVFSPVVFRHRPNGTLVLPSRCLTSCVRFWLGCEFAWLAPRVWSGAA